jgi:hypothetical protein
MSSIASSGDNATLGGRPPLELDPSHPAAFLKTHLEQPVIPAAREVAVLRIPREAPQPDPVGDGDLLAEVDKHHGRPGGARQQREGGPGANRAGKDPSTGAGEEASVGTLCCSWPGLLALLQPVCATRVRSRARRSVARARTRDSGACERKNRRPPKTVCDGGAPPRLTHAGRTRLPRGGTAISQGRRRKGGGVVAHGRRINNMRPRRELQSRAALPLAFRQITLTSTP